MKQDGVDKSEIEKLKSEIEKVEAQHALRQQVIGADLFDERELRLIQNCKVYAAHDPAGLPGHNLMIIVAKMSRVLGI